MRITSGFRSSCQRTSSIEWRCIRQNGPRSAFAPATSTRPVQIRTFRSANMASLKSVADTSVGQPGKPNHRQAAHARGRAGSLRDSASGTPTARRLDRSGSDAAIEHGPAGAAVDRPPSTALPLHRTPMDQVRELRVSIAGSIRPVRSDNESTSSALDGSRRGQHPTDLSRPSALSADARKQGFG